MLVDVGVRCSRARTLERTVSDTEPAQRWGAAEHALSIRTGCGKQQARRSALEVCPNAVELSPNLPHFPDFPSKESIRIVMCYEQVFLKQPKAAEKSC